MEVPLDLVGDHRNGGVGAQPPDADNLMLSTALDFKHNTNYSYEVGYELIWLLNLSFEVIVYSN